MYSQFRWSLFSISGENLVEITGLEERPAILSKKPGDRGGGNSTNFIISSSLISPKIVYRCELSNWYPQKKKTKCVAESVR